MNHFRWVARIGAAVLVCAFLATAQHRVGTLQQSAPPEVPAAPAAADETPAIRANNIGVALMERHDFPDALGKFQTACIMAAKNDTGCLNAGIALLNMQHFDEAREALTKYAASHADSARVWFNLALLERAARNVPAAMDDLQKVAALDPDDADTQFFIGFIQAEQGHDAQAAAAFQKCLALDPLHVSAEYALSQALEHLGKDYDAQTHLERFHRLTALGLAKPERFLYGEQGEYSRAEWMTAQSAPAVPAAPIHFVDVTAASGLASAFATEHSGYKALTRGRGPGARGRGGRGQPDAAAVQSAEAATPAPQSLASFLGAGACVLDYDGDGRLDVFLVDGDGKGHAALYRNTGGGHFVNVTKQAKIEFQGEGTGCAVGDYDNDGHPDLAISSAQGITLLHNDGHGAFTDVTDAAGVRIDGLAMGVTFVDYDGDGDLDLYATRFADLPLGDPKEPFAFPADATGPGNILWRNKGDGTFEDVTRATGLRGSGPAVSTIATHLRDGAALDLVVAGWMKTPTAFLNMRDGPFRAAAMPWPADMPADTAGVVAFDFDGDGWMDLAFTHWTQPGLSLWRNVRGKSFERVDLPDAGWMRGWGVAAFDYDNDGRPDLIAVGEGYAVEGRIQLLRNEGAAGFRDVTKETGLDKIVLRNPRAVIPFDFDGSGAPGLLITQNHAPPALLKEVGANKNDSLEFGVMGDGDNKMGLGARVEIFAGGQRETWEIPGASGYLSQGPAQVTAGLADEGTADVVRILWPGGVLQDELQMRAGKSKPVEESSQGANR